MSHLARTILGPRELPVKQHILAFTVVLTLVALTGIPVHAQGADARVGPVPATIALLAHGSVPAMRERAATQRIAGPGAATIRQRAASSSTGWMQQAELDDPAGVPFDFFGYSVAMSGDTALVAAADGNNGAGMAYVFVRSGASWSQQAVLTPSDAGGAFGYSVALSGDTALIGAPAALNGAGAAYVFVRNGTSWSQEAELVDPAPTASIDSLGISVALSGDTALVGAYGRNNYAGTAFVFVRQGSSWSQQAELDDPTPVGSFDLFGSSVALSGDTALVSTPYKDNGVGAAYVFVRSGTAWRQQAILTASDAEGTFGWSTGSLALEGNTALVGAWGGNGTRSTGATYVFVRTGTTWAEQAELVASDAAPGDEFGWSVALSGDAALIGAAGRNIVAGAAYVFVRHGAAWTQQAELDDPAPVVAEDGFGISVALGGNKALIGAYGRNNYAGAAYVFVHS